MAAASDDLALRVAVLEASIVDVQSNVAPEDRKAEHARVEAALRDAGVHGAALFRVPSDYYGRKLPARAALLCCSVDRLCKTLVLENSVGDVVGDLSAPLYRQRYIAVLLQYVTRLDVPVLTRFLSASAAAAGAQGAAYAAASLAVAPLEAAARLTGFAFNGMTPFGSVTPLPLVVSRSIADVPQPRFVWLGGGEPDLKLRMFTTQLLAPGTRGRGSPAPTVLDCTLPRGGEDASEGLD